MAAVLALVAIATTTLPVTTALAATQRTSFNDVENEVMCVSCGVPLTIAESTQADDERAEIRSLIAQGLTKQQVKDKLVAEYGHAVLALPQDKGFGLAAYLVPIAIAIGGLTLLAVVLPRWRRARADAMIASAQTNGSSHTALTADDAKRLEEDLERYEV